jgi:CRP/FNR family cyclic AMP-dependent transcriptional regulator
MPELNIVEKVIALEAVDLLKNLTPDQLARIATIAKEVSFAPGTVILDPKRTIEALYVVLDGTVRLETAEGVSTEAVQNDVLGAWALFDPEPLNVTATAIGDAKLLRIARDDFYDLLSDNMEITASIFSMLVKRFRQLVNGK